MRKFKVLSMLVIVAIVVIVTGCEKNENLINSELINNDSEILKSSSANYYGVNELILNHFIHYCQRKAGPYEGFPYYGEGYLSLDVAKQACCPTSYMMAAACLAHYKDGSSSQYNANGSKLSGIISSFSGTSYRYLSSMSSYANNTDGSFITSSKKLSCSSRSSIKDFIETSLANDKFVMMNINANIYNYSTVNNTLLYQNSSNNPDVSYGTSLYVSENDESTNGIGAHVILIIRIDKDINGNGIVQYIDPLAITRSNSNRKYMLYSKLLNSNQVSGNNSYYDAISVGLK